MSDGLTASLCHTASPIEICSLSFLAQADTSAEGVIDRVSESLLLATIME